MLKRVLRLAALLLWAVIWAAPAVAAAPHRVVAVGDLHGDYEVWTAIARAAGIMDEQNHWSGGTATLVQLGDIVDRGPNSLAIIRSLQQLQREAPAAGGAVIVLLGNHEAMNLLGDLRYVTAADYAALADDRSFARREQVYMANRRTLEAAARRSNPNVRPSQVREQWLARTPLGWVEHQSAWSPRGELGRWATSNPAVVKVGDTLFVHGGISSEYARLGIDEINRRVATAMAKADGSPSSVLGDPLGPLWYRGLVTRDPRVDPDGAAAAKRNPRPPLDQEIADVLAATGAKRIVVGHTPILSGIAISHEGRLIRVDTGNSRYYGGQPSYLEIVGDKVTAHAVPRPAEQGGAG